MTAPIPGFGDEEYTKGLVAKRARTSEQPADVPRRSRRQQSEMDLFTDSSTTCLTLCWAYCDFRQMCSLFSWNWPFMNYFRGQWQQAWPLIPNTQGGRVWIHRTWESKRTRTEKPSRRLSLAEWKLRSVIDHCPSFIYTFVLQGRNPGLRPMQEPISVEELHLKTHFESIYRRLANI